MIDHQLVQLKLNEMHALTEALRSYVMRVAWERDKGGPVSAHAGLVMNLSTDIIQRVTRLNMDVHGAGRVHDVRAGGQARSATRWCGRILPATPVQRAEGGEAARAAEVAARAHTRAQDGR